jgi:MYXO-CTERM domain-containing protein
MTRLDGLRALSVLCFAAVGCSDFSIEEESSALTGRKGVDYSWARPSPSGLKKAGYSFVARYYSVNDSANHGKILFKTEANALIAAGLDIVTVWEHSAQDALGGHSAGVADAKAASAQAANAGQPSTRPIYFAVDFDAIGSQLTTVGAYFDGVASVLGRSRTGAYGGYSVIKYLFDHNKIDWGWQCYAWSYGKWDSRAHFRQTQNNISAAGSSGCCDLDLAAAADFGQWGQEPDWSAQVVKQSWPPATTAMTIACGQDVPASITLRNTGAESWNSKTQLATTVPRDRTSLFAGSDWSSPSRPAHVTGTVAPKSTFVFKFTFHGPTGTACVPGTYHEHFGVVQDGAAWFSAAGQGGPPDSLIEAQITLVPAATEPPQQDAGTTARADGDVPQPDLGGDTREVAAPTRGDASGCSVGGEAGSASLVGLGLLFLIGLLRRRRSATGRLAGSGRPTGSEIDRLRLGPTPPARRVDA